MSNMDIRLRPGVVRQARMERMLSQADLANLAGVGVFTIIRWERDEPGMAQRETLFKVAKALKVKHTELIEPMSVKEGV